MTTFQTETEEKIARIRRATAQPYVANDDVEFLLDLLATTQHQLRTQQGLVADAYERGRRAGWQAGYSEGYAEILGEMS